MHHCTFCIWDVWTSVKKVAMQWVEIAMACCVPKQGCSRKKNKWCGPSLPPCGFRWRGWQMMQFKASQRRRCLRRRRRRRRWRRSWIWSSQNLASQMVMRKGTILSIALAVVSTDLSVATNNVITTYNNICCTRPVVKANNGVFLYSCAINHNVAEEHMKLLACRCEAASSHASLSCFSLFQPLPLSNGGCHRRQRKDLVEHQDDLPHYRGAQLLWNFHYIYDPAEQWSLGMRHIPIQPKSHTDVDLFFTTTLTLTNIRFFLTLFCHWKFFGSRILLNGVSAQFLHIFTLTFSLFSCSYLGRLLKTYTSNSAEL